MAWSDASLPDAIDEQTARNLIARRVIDAVKIGERDLVRLKGYALQAFRKPE
jgi:hypothetical protein